jgi:hypothetical protein
MKNSTLLYLFIFKAIFVPLVKVITFDRAKSDHSKQLLPYNLMAFISNFED